MNLLWIIDKIINIFSLVLFIRIVLSWIMPNTRNEFTDIVYNITEPVLKRCRIIIPINHMTYLDLAPIIAYFGLRVLRYVLFYIVTRFF